MSKDIVSEIVVRRALRAFSTENVDQEIIRRIMEAARLAPSCGNKQPWRFLVLSEEIALQKGFKALSGGNYWAKHCAFLVFGITKRDLDCQMPDGREYALLDTGMAVENMMLQAVHEGLTAHPMAGYNPSTVVEEFCLPEGYEVVIAIAFGYPGDGDYLGDKHKALENEPQSRKKYDEVITMNEWNI